MKNQENPTAIIQMTIQEFTDKYYDCLSDEVFEDFIRGAVGGMISLKIKSTDFYEESNPVDETE